MPDDTPGEFARLLAEAVELQLEYERKMTAESRQRVSDAEMALIKFWHSPDGRRLLPGDELQRRMRAAKAEARTARESEVGDGASIPSDLH